MKHHSFHSVTGLPDAPLAMPKQQLERDWTWFDRLRSALLVWQRR